MFCPVTTAAMKNSDCPIDLLPVACHHLVREVLVMTRTCSAVRFVKIKKHSWPMTPGRQTIKTPLNTSSIFNVKVIFMSHCIVKTGKRVMIAFQPLCPLISFLKSKHSIWETSLRQWSSSHTGVDDLTLGGMLLVCYVGWGSLAHLHSQHLSLSSYWQQATIFTNADLQ